MHWKRTIPNDNEAQVGIGTMIVFIATVLVAAVAAGVLIDMSGKLQEKSSRTGSEATAKVASNLDIEGLVGKRDNATASGLQDLQLFVALSPGATEVDISLLKIQIYNGTSLQILDYASGTPAAGEYGATEVRDVDGSFTTSIPVMTSGDLIRLDIPLDANTLEFEPRESIRLALIPEVGNQVVLGFQTPNSYGNNLVIDLH